MSWLLSALWLAARGAAQNSWSPIGPQPIRVPASPFLASSGPIISGRVTAIAVNPQNNDVVYLGAASGGIWKSTDGGASWTPLTDFQPSLATGSLAIDPSSCTADDCTTIYVGTGEVYGSSIYFGAGILKSTDAGATWTKVAAISGQGTGLSFDVNNSGLVYAALSQATAAGIYRSTDHGVTWSRLSGTGVNLFPATGVGYIALSVVSGAAGAAGGATLYAAVQQLNSNSLRGVWKSRDSGANWAQLLNTPNFCFP